MLHRKYNAHDSKRLVNDGSLTRMLNKTIRVTSAGLGILICASQGIFAAEDTPAAATAGDEGVYQAVFFAQYTPQNAMDMIDRLPGFTFKRGSNVRGFGGAAGNVLIDGARPTSKSGGLRSALQRIPAAQVERVEILRGGVGAEAGGQSIVANIVRKSGGSSGTWKITDRRMPITGKHHPQIEATLVGKLGVWDTSFDVNTGTEGGYRTAEIVERDADDVLVDVNDEDYITKWHWFVASAEGSRPLAGGKFTINGRMDIFRENADTERLGYVGRFPDTQNDNFWHLDAETKRKEFEIGLNWNRTYANGWRWNLIGLSNFYSSKYNSDTTDQDLAENTLSFDEYSQEKIKSEHILRTTYGDTTGKLRPEFGIEFARNQLENLIDKTEDGIVVSLDSANVLVTEMRGEAFATLVYKASSKLSLDGGVTYEASRLTVTGDANQTQNFKFLKPRLSATYSFNDAVQLTLTGERIIGQLNLNDFGASQAAEDDRTTAGNPDLRPDKKTKISAIVNWKYSDRGSLRVEVNHEWRSDILEQIILPSGSEGVGNAGNARFWSIRTDLNIPLDFLLPGALIEIEHRLRRSSFSDPILGGAIRDISYYTPNWLKFSFRQDLTKYKVAWGVNYYGSFQDVGYNVDEISKFQGNKRLSVFVETTRYLGVKAKLNVGFVNTGIFTRTRTFFDGSRAGEITGTEISRRVRRPQVTFSVSGTF